MRLYFVRMLISSDDYVLGVLLLSGRHQWSNHSLFYRQKYAGFAGVCRRILSFERKSRRIKSRRMSRRKISGFFKKPACAGACRRISGVARKKPAYWKPAYLKTLKKNMDFRFTRCRSNFCSSTIDRGETEIGVCTWIGMFFLYDDGWEFRQGFTKIPFHSYGTQVSSWIH